MRTKIIAIIPARSGSKGLRNKNALMLIDKPLLAYTIEAALQSEMFEKVIVTTDSEQYGAIAESYGADFLLRPEELATDKASSFEFIKHALSIYTDYENFALLQPTSPFRDSTHIIEAVKLYQTLEKYQCVVSVTRSNKPSQIIRPLDDYSTLSFFDLDYSKYNRNSIVEYHPNGAIFIANKQHYLHTKHFFGRYSLAYIMDKESSLDIDDRMDFELAITIQQKKNRQKILYQNIHNRINEKRNEFDSVSDITLIGHSLFDYWDVKKINDIKVNNLGIAGINSKEYYEYIIEKELIVNFGEFVFIFFGTNDIVVSDWKKEDTLWYLKKTCQYIKKKNAASKIYLLSVPPVFGRIDRDNRIINDLNSYLRENVDFAKFISLDHVLKDSYGNLNKMYTYDGLHFNSNGSGSLCNAS